MPPLPRSANPTVALKSSAVPPRARPTTVSGPTMPSAIARLAAVSSGLLLTKALPLLVQKPSAWGSVYPAPR